MNWTKLSLYAVAAAAVGFVVFGVVQDTGNALWAVLPAVFVAVYAADRDRGCSWRRRNDA